MGGVGWGREALTGCCHRIGLRGASGAFLSTRVSHNARLRLLLRPETGGEQCKTSFVVDEVSNIIKEAVEGAIGGNAYQHSKVNQWTTSVVEQTLSQLTKLGKPFKYIVTCVIMQKNGAGLHTASSCFWDNTSDGNCTVRWENKTMYCIVSAFGLAI
ncbi:dynein light chain Tctex-type 1 isoform X1 [Pelodiscus sinensis]|uniref:dynein light chain Tctex-type 1 isoform X1 n=1 Tax=Pelodiscus sinensis TaxID=13735 RepID=UPI000D724534|nr:dynein light chain Tctex-type 1 isoform X1 [Pelodiscus sinensis]|eukprot:XP_025036442.1 dynein light chain Tctex-type 1 isoform X1 [Pelodiscus sinensis]